MKYFVYVITAIVIAAGIALVARPKPVPVDSAQVVRGPFDEILTADGVIQSRTKRTLYAFASGNVGDLKVKVGDRVKKDEVLTRLIWDYDRPVASPFDGVVSRIYRDSSGPINRGEPIVEISALSDLEVVADLLTTDAVRLAPGGTARILNWGMDEPLAAEITVVSHAGTVKTSALGVDEERTAVRLKLLRVPPEILNRLGDTYHVDVAFQVSHENDVLKIPLGALFKNGEAWAVYVIENSRARLRPIQISKKNDKEIVVVQGLSAGEKIVLFPGDKVREGTLVQ